MHFRYLVEEFATISHVDREEYAPYVERPDLAKTTRKAAAKMRRRRRHESGQRLAAITAAKEKENGCIDEPGSESSNAKTGG